MINLAKLVEHQKNRRAVKIKKRILKQAHDKKPAEFLNIKEKIQRRWTNLPKNEKHSVNWNLKMNYVN